jgi:chromosome segregation ATPase
MAESKTNQILITLAEIKKDTGEIFRRLDKINGSIADYSITKKRIDDLEENYNKLEDCIEETSKLLTCIKIKVWGMAGLIGAIMGFIGVVVGKFI